MAIRMDEMKTRKKWLDNIREDCKDMTCLCTKHLISCVIGHFGEILFTIWAVGALAQRHRRQGHKSSKSRHMNGDNSVDI